MSDSARTPEELEMHFEDALLLRDCAALLQLFEPGSAFVVPNARPARGGAEIARLALATWRNGATYIADPSRVVQARDLALIIDGPAINVARRDRDGIWRYAIVFVENQCGTKGVLDGNRSDASAKRSPGNR